MKRIISSLGIVLILLSILVMRPVQASAVELPDLEPVQIAVTALYAGADNTVSVVVANNGKATVNSFGVKLEASESDGPFQEVETRSGNYISSCDDAYYCPLSVNFNWTPAESADYTLRVTVDPSGEVEEAEENNNIREKSVQVDDLGPVTIQVRIEGMNSTIWNGAVTFCDSSITDKQGDTHQVDHPTALGALAAAAEEGDFEYVVSSAYGPLTYVESAGGDNNQGANGWLYLDNWQSPSVAAVDYTLADNDEVLWYYGGWAAKPLKISADKVNLTEEESFTITVQEYDGTGWSGTQGAEVQAGSNTFTTDADGQAADISLPAGNYTIFAAKDSYETYIRSNTLDIVVEPSNEQTYPLSADDIHITQALDYLKEAQKTNGSIGDFAPSCWVIMAIAAAGQDPHTWTVGNNSVVTYLSKNATANIDTGKATDVERLILSIVAAGENPRSFGGTNYIEVLNSLYDGNQMGDLALVNDDIWAILALQPAGIDSEIIANIKEYILENQNEDGGWSWAAGGESDADNTAAAISALIAAGITPDDQLILDALSYLKTQQHSNGGFVSEGSTNSAVDAWVIRALNDAGQNPIGDDWKIGENTPVSHVLSMQDSDGAFKWTSSTRSYPEWMTAYAVTALLAAEWPEDGTPPEITSFKPASGSKTGTTSPLIKAVYSDSVSGVDESSIQMWLDESEVESAEIDESSISFKTQSMPLGEHTVKVSVSDKKGNQTEKSWTFKVTKASSGGGGGGGNTPDPTPTPTPTQTPTQTSSTVTSTEQTMLPVQQTENDDLTNRDNQTSETIAENKSDSNLTQSISSASVTTSSTEISGVETSTAAGLKNAEPDETSNSQTLKEKESSVNWVMLSVIGAGLLILALIAVMILSRRKAK
jgi:hypothetical protein